MAGIVQAQGGRYTLRRCPRASCGGIVRQKDNKWYCRKCAIVIPALPRELNSTNVDNLRWDGSKWYFLKQKKLK